MRRADSISHSGKPSVTPMVLRAQRGSSGHSRVSSSTLSMNCWRRAIPSPHASAETPHRFLLRSTMSGSRLASGGSGKFSKPKGSTGAPERLNRASPPFGTFQQVDRRNRWSKDPPYDFGILHANTIRNHCAKGSQSARNVLNSPATYESIALWVELTLRRCSCRTLSSPPARRVAVGSTENGHDWLSHGLVFSTKIS